MRVFTGLTLLDTIQGTVGAVSLIPDAITPHEEAVYTNIAFMESVHAKSYSSIFSTLLDARDRRRVPLVGGEPEPSEEGPHRHGLLPWRRAPQAQGRLDPAGVVPVLLGLLPADALVERAKLTNTADIIRLIIRDEAVHGYYIGYKFQKGLEQLDQASATSSRTTPRCCTSSTTTRCSTRRTSTTGRPHRGRQAFLHYNANKALMNLGYEAMFPSTVTNVNPAILSALRPTPTRTTTSSRVGLVVRHRQGRRDRGRRLGLLKVLKTTF
jgi:ribonucleoside-diphosphate reductase beta chain